MGHTNSTANLSLPQFIGTDKPTWLGDVNGAFGAIDTAVGTINADILAVDAKADNAVADASSAVTVANNASTTAGNASTTATTANNIANNALTVANNAVADVVAIGNKMGLLANLTTTDKSSIVNAINEVNAKTITVSVSAEDVAYNNTVSGLTATNVQDAIDEVAQGGGGAGYVVHSINKTVDQAVADIVSFLSNNTKDAVLKIQTSANEKIYMHLDGIIYDSANAFSSATFRSSSGGSSGNIYDTLLVIGPSSIMTYRMITINASGTVTNTDDSSSASTRTVLSVSTI